MIALMSWVLCLNEILTCADINAGNVGDGDGYGSCDVKDCGGRDDKEEWSYTCPSVWLD